MVLTCTKAMFIIFRTHSLSKSTPHSLANRYDPLSSCLVDFKGRANMASVKNCQFVVSEPGHEAATAGEWFVLFGVVL